MERIRYTKSQVAGIVFLTREGSVDLSKPVWEQITGSWNQLYHPLSVLMNKSAQQARDIYGSEWTNITKKGRMAPELDQDHIYALLQEAEEVVKGSGSIMRKLRQSGFDGDIFRRARQVICSDHKIQF